MSADDDNPYLTEEDLRKISDRYRLAWAAIVCDRIMGLYSPYFRATYRFQEAIDFAWNVALGTPWSHENWEELICFIQDQESAIESDGYNENVLYSPIGLLLEVKFANIKAAEQAVDYATIAFAEHQIYRQGVCERDDVVPEDYYLELSVPAYAFAKRLYSRIAVPHPPTIYRHWFDDEILDMTYPLLPPEIVQNKSIDPPEHEIRHISSLYSSQ